MIIFSVFLQDRDEFLPNFGLAFFDVKDGFIHIRIALG